MKIRKLADAAIVAAILMVSIPDLNVHLTPDDLLQHSASAAIQTEHTPDADDDPASRELF